LKTSFRKASKAPRVVVKRLPTSESTPVLQLVQMPALVLRRITHFLDVTSLENLAAACDFFHKLVSARGVTTLNIPFSNKFIAELNAVKTYHKKEVFRLRSLKEDDTCVPDDEAVFVEYMISSQLALVNLKKLREVQLMPSTLEAQGQVERATNSRLAVFVDFDRILMRRLDQLGCLTNLTRLEVLVDKQCHLEEHMSHLTNLIKLGLTVTSLKAISTTDFETFLCRLESLVTSCRASELTIRVVAERKRKYVKVFSNDFVKKLTVIAPCDFNAHLKMSQLEEVSVDYPSPNQCNFFRSPVGDRGIHRSGVCCVSLASVFQRCPNIASFAGVKIGHIGMDQTFVKWNNRMKKLFHYDYLERGGEQDFKVWSKTRGGRWFSKQEDLPAAIGHDRVFDQPGAIVQQALQGLNNFGDLDLQEF